MSAIRFILICSIIGFGVGTAKSDPCPASLSFHSDHLADRIIEQCSTTYATVQIRLDTIASDTLYFEILTEGTATDSADYIFNRPDTIVFLPGQQIKAYQLNVVLDTLEESTESIDFSLIQLNPDSLCDQLTVLIEDHLDVGIKVADSASYCFPIDVLLYGTGAQNYSWTAVGLFDQEQSDSIRIDTVYSDYIFITASGPSCQDNDSVLINTFDPSFELSIQPDDTLCLGDTLIVLLDLDAQIDSLSVTPDSILLRQDSTRVYLRPQSSGPITISSFADSCSYRDSFRVVVEFLSVPAVISDTMLCLGDSIVLSTADSSQTNYRWTPDSYLSDSTIANPIAFPQKSTEYIRMATSSFGRCNTKDTVQIELRDTAYIYELLDSFLICPGDTALARLMLIDSNANVQIFPDQYGTLKSDTLSFFPNQTEVYHLLLDYEVCQKQIVQPIQVVDTGYSIQLLTKDTICTGASVQTLVQAPNATISWTPAQDVHRVNDSLFLLQPTQTTRIECIFDFGVCTRTVPIDVFVIDNDVKLEPLSQDTICLGDSLLFKLIFDRQAGQIQWSDSSIVNQLNDSIYAIVPKQSRSISLNIDFSACSFDYTFDIVVLEPEFNFVQDHIRLCKGDTVEVPLVTNIPVKAFDIYPNQAVRIIDSVLALYPRNSISYKLDADFGYCRISRDLTVSVDSLPNLNWTVLPQKDKYCIGDTINIEPSDFNLQLYPNIVFEWSPSDANLLSDPSSASARFGVKNSGLYERVTTNGACTLRDIFEIKAISDKIKSNFTDTSICKGEPIRFEVFDEDLTDFFWLPDQGLSCTRCPDPIIQTDISRQYSLRYRRESCTYQQEVNIHVKPIDTIVFPVLFACPDSIVRFDIDNGRFRSGLWDFEAELSCTDCLNPSLRAVDTKRYIFRDFTGDCELIAIQDLVVYPRIEAKLLFEDVDDSFLGQQITIGSEVTASNPVIYQWFVNGILQDEMGSELSFRAEEFDYRIVLKVTDRLSSCSAEAELVLSVKAIDQIHFPNTFTPNGDGRNDLFKPALAETLTIRYMKIFNRWGEAIYSSTASDAAWDGRDFSGVLQAPDSYIYLVELVRPNGKIERFRGEINLLR